MKNSENNSNAVVQSGRHWSLSPDGTIEVFNEKGRKSEQGGSGTIELLGIEVNAPSIKPQIQDCFEDASLVGKGSDISQLHCRAQQCIMLFLEGLITSEHLAQSTEQNDCINIPNVTIDGRVLTVRVFERLPFNLAIADATGEILAIGELKGSNFCLYQGRITFFEAQGITLQGGDWAINAFDWDALFQVSPDSMLPLISELIANDIAFGNEDKLSLVLVGPRQGVILFLEGKITRSHLRHAVECEEYVDIPQVNFDGRFLTVRVLKNPEHVAATADSDGNII